jgi:hypothetical protein
MRGIEDARYGEVAGVSERKRVLTKRRDTQLSLEEMTAEPPCQRQLEANRNIVINRLPFRALDHSAS